MSHVKPIKVTETVMVATPSVACDGGERFGHPRVFLNVAQRGEIVCPYCSRLYVLDKTAKVDHGH